MCCTVSVDKLDYNYIWNQAISPSLMQTRPGFPQIRLHQTVFDGKLLTVQMFGPSKYSWDIMEFIWLEKSVRDTKCDNI